MSVRDLLTAHLDDYVILFRQLLQALHAQNSVAAPSFAGGAPPQTHTQTQAMQISPSASSSSLHAMAIDRDRTPTPTLGSRPSSSSLGDAADREDKDKENKNRAAAGGVDVIAASAAKTRLAMDRLVRKDQLLQETVDKRMCVIVLSCVLYRFVIHW